MNYLPPLRNYQQMVRIVQNDSGHANTHHSHANFSLGNAFGNEHEHSASFDHLFSNGGVSPTELQMRTLDSMNLPSSSPRRQGKINHGGLYPTRAASSLFHSLNDTSRDYFNGVGQQVTSRRDAGPGTKLRTELTPHASNKIRHKRGTFSHYEDHHQENHQTDHRTPTSYLHHGTHTVTENQNHTQSHIQSHMSSFHSNL